MHRLGAVVSFGLLMLVKGLSHLFFRFDVGWVGEVPPDPWRKIRVTAILNHTSLYEPVFAAVPPPGFFWRLSNHGVVPIAEKTLDRPLVGRFFRFVARHVVSLTRRRDETWESLLAKVDDPKAMIIILPEGRMKRRDGRDSKGRPMTVRSGIADVLETVPEGRLLLAYSGGLHHVQAPGEGLPRPFRKVWIRLELLDIPSYRERLRAAGGGSDEGWRRAVVADLTERRDRWCPELERTTAEAYPEGATR